MFTQTTEYALRAVAYLAKDPESPRTTQQIAEVTMVPPDYLAKVLKDLSRSGLVRSQRGPSGGFWLDRDPNELTVLEVVNAVGAIPRIRSCPLDLPEHRHELCPLHRLLDDAAAQIERAFSAATIGALIATTNEYADFRGPLGRRAAVDLTTSARSPAGAEHEARPSGPDDD